MRILALWDKGVKAGVIAKRFGITYDRVRAIYFRLTETPEERELRLNAPLNLPSPERKARQEARESKQSKGWEKRLIQVREEKRRAQEARERRQIRRFILLCEEADNHYQNRIWVRVDGRIRTHGGGYRTVHNQIFDDDRAYRGALALRDELQIEHHEME